MADLVQQMNEVLRPVAPPRVLEDVYSDDQHERILEVIKQQRAVADDHRAPLRHGRGA